jgi:hypothetical protein
MITSTVSFWTIQNQMVWWHDLERTSCVLRYNPSICVEGLGKIGKYLPQTGLPVYGQESEPSISWIQVWKIISWNINPSIDSTGSEKVILLLKAEHHGICGLEYGPRFPTLRLCSVEWKNNELCVCNGRCTESVERGYALGSKLFRY